MALVVYDQGVRIQTPVSSLLPPRGVEATTESARSRELPSSGDQALPPKTQTPLQTPTGQANISLEQRLNSSRAQQAYQQTQRLNRRASDHQKPTQVSQIMTSPVFTIPVGATVQQAYQQFQSHNVHHLAVVDARGACHGVVSEYVLLRRTSLLNPIGPITDGLTIDGTYPAQLIAATPDTPISQVAITFLKSRLSSMPVINNNGALLGIVTHTDLVHMVANEAARERWI
ncbi:HPP family protein [Motiliproteus sp.]|uniref:CBS domain-containing protein n=1 Tax=Motiliproteus sp. TaxID=1898955 RepID=UPI003BAA505A